MISWDLLDDRRMTSDTDGNRIGIRAKIHCHRRKERCVRWGPRTSARWLHVVQWIELFDEPFDFRLLLAVLVASVEPLAVEGLHAVLKFALELFDFRIDLSDGTRRRRRDGRVNNVEDDRRR